jgi:cytochrome c-type biogenesis protein CcmH/NrfG
MTSGPLPAPQGFQHLEDIVATRPNDAGALMALAVAYRQGGHLEHAMYQFKRLLKIQQVPAPMLQMVEDQLSDMEADVAGVPRFHQLRGELFMKQGRFQDAIEEYNRVGQ